MDSYKENSVLQIIKRINGLKIMVELSYTKEMLVESAQLADNMGSLNNSITGGRANRAAFLGELALCYYLGATRDDKLGYDLMLGDLKIEVKSKRRTAHPRPNYSGSVAVTSNHQKPDFFAFLSLTFDGKKMVRGKEYYFDLNSIWFCGMISYDDFILKSKLMKKGQKDPSNGFIVLTDMRNISYSELHEKIY